MTSQRAVMTCAGTSIACNVRTSEGGVSSLKFQSDGAGRLFASANRYSRSSSDIRSMVLMRSSVSTDAPVARPCSSHVYHVRLIPVSVAMSSRRSPEVWRRNPGCRPTSAGDNRARQAFKRSPKARNLQLAGSAGARSGCVFIARKKAWAASPINPPVPCRE